MSGARPFSLGFGVRVCCGQTEVSNMPTAPFFLTAPRTKFPCLTLINPLNPDVRKSHKNIYVFSHFARLRKSRRDFAKGLRPGKNFPATFIDHQRSSNCSRARSLNSRLSNSLLRHVAFLAISRRSMCEYRTRFFAGGCATYRSHPTVSGRDSKGARSPRR